MSATTIYYNYNTQEWNDDKVTIVDCSKDFMHPMIIRNGTVSSTKMNFIRGATQEETGEWFNTISTLQVDLRKFVLDESHRYLIGHSSGSDTLVADNVVSNITSGITQAFWIIYSQSSQISRMIKIGSVSRNTKFYLYTLDYFFIHGLRRVGFAGELPAPYISIADNNYKPNEHLMIFQFSVSQVNAQPTVNKIAELPPPLFVPPRISIPTIMGSVPIVIVKDIVYGNDATLYFTGVFNTKIQFLDILTTIDSKKESSVFFGVLDPNNGTVVFITKIEPTLAIEYNSVNVNLMEISSNYQEIYITGTVQTFLEDVGFVQKVFIASYDISQPSAPVLRWNHIIGIDGAKSIDDIICLNGKLIINVLLANFSNVVTQISTQDGAFISALLIYDSPYFGVRTSLNADKDLVVVGKKGNVFANIDWDSFITFGVPSSVTLFSQKFKINTIQNSDELILEEVYREPILKGSIIATQSITLTTDTYNPRKFYVATTFSGSVQVIGDSNARINPVGFSNALISTIIEGCDTCESECIIPLCGPYTQDDSRACSGRGRCDSPNSCSCSLSTFSGETCQYPICFGVPQNYTSVCSGNGRCAFHDYCVCNDGYSGTNCEIARCFGLYATNDSVCSSHGDCVANDICKCFYNYTGEQCSFEIVQGYTHCGVGNYLYNQSSADRFVSPIMLYGFPPSLYISFDAHGQISYTGYGISPTLHSLGNGISVKFGSVLNASSELYSSILLIDQNNTLQEGIVVTSVTSDDYSNTWIVGWKQLQVFGLTQFIGVLIKLSLMEPFRILRNLERHSRVHSNGFLQSMLTFQNVYNTSFDVDSSGYTYVTGVIKPGGSNIGDPNEKQPRFFAAKYCVRNHERWYKERPLDSREVYASIYSAYSEMDRLYVVAFVNKTLPSLPTIYTIMFKDEECRQCPIGTILQRHGRSSYCTACPATTYNPLKASTSNNSCLYCDPGYFNDQEGQSACFKCDVGTYAPTKGARECLSCDPGTYAPKDGLSSCLPCPPGQYSDKSGEWACESCPTGHYQPLYGQNSSESCLKCLPGSFSSSVGNGNCTLCPAGFYNPNPGSSTALDCIKCPSGQYSSAEGSSQCTECDVGTYNENIGSSNASSCLPCTPGTFSNRKGQASCTKCAAGTYLSKSGSFSESDCLLCPIGFYSNMSGSSFCFSCPTGSTTSSAGSLNSTACIACEKAVALKRKKRAEDEMLSKLLEHNTKSFYASTDTTTHQTANLIPIEDLEFKERVSEGAGGVIFRAAWKGTEVAVKRIKSNQFGSDDDETFEHEASILIGLRHPNVVLMMGVSVDEDNKYIITEFVKGGSLDKLIYNKKKAKNEIITFGRKLEILKDICRALIYLHNTRPPIIHRDLKPQNVLLDEAGLAKVCDFGVSKPLSSLTMTGVCYGTIQYTSPEILKQSRRYTTKCDVYSFAILMYELFFMVHPYSDLPKCPVSNHTKKSLAFLTSSNSDSSSPHLSDSYSGSGNSGDTTNNTSDMISIFAIGNDVIHGKRPMIPWENTLPSLQQQPHARPILQIQSSPTNLDSTILDVNSPTIIDEDVLKLEWYLHCNKTVKNSEITKPESLVPIIDSFISIMKACWANDDTERPDFSQILDSLEQLHKEWTEVLNSQ
ncbi:hypothetical protein C9374_013627 [Naegleria lovaniensis]|uniref:Uncharacterized protein n=1 Tax=Naegleria lovaniensis TaxID=51637 RepID=A0AA88KDW9_NAELO|nr:uncharacterized protein C9374_013627 [Naegleria lovaniensis]KAG2372726.1 hypothetical protein C9374_013627 [Naegleria lovaniensis]